MPRPSRPRCPTTGARRLRRAVGAALLGVCAAALGACSSPGSSAGTAPDGLVALVADAKGTSLLGWDGSGGDAVPITLPVGATTWVAAGRADVLAATLADGGTATSDPVHLGKRLAWRAVKLAGATGTTGGAPKGPIYFAAWDASGGRFATITGDLESGVGIRVVLIDPTAGTSIQIPISRSVVAAPPVWIDDRRLVLVTGDAAEPTATIVDTTTRELTDGPIGARTLATSASGRVIATMAEQGAPVVVRDTAGWLSGDGSSIASIDPPRGSTTAIAFALDAIGQRLVIAWAASDGTVTLAVHDGRSAWRRVAQPKIGSARGAVVAWRR
jgi:hypothetical protein